MTCDCEFTCGQCGDTSPLDDCMRDIRGALLPDTDLRCPSCGIIVRRKVRGYRRLGGHYVPTAIDLEVVLA